MQDGIIAGNGNSRYLKTVAEALSLYPTYQDFIAALIAGTFPIDLNGINTAGWVQQGTALNKANLLADVTASSIGLGGDATPNSAIAKLKFLIDNLSISKPDITVGTYPGTGGSKVINLGFTPKAVIVSSWHTGFGSQQVDVGSNSGGLAVTNGPQYLYAPFEESYIYLKIVDNGFYVMDNNFIFVNTAGTNYNYLAVK